MASKRQQQIAEIIKRNFSTVLMQEGSYIYGTEALVSVTNVIMSSDLRLAKIYVSIYNTTNKEEVMQALEKNTPTLKHSLVTRVRRHVQFIPDLAIYNDDLLDEMYRVDQMLDDL